MRTSIREQKILKILLEHKEVSSSDIHQRLFEIGEEFSLVTIKRAISDMAARGLLIVTGAGRSSAYTISVAGRVFLDTDATLYGTVDPDRRPGLRGYNFDLFPNMPSVLFEKEEYEVLREATQVYKKRTENVSPTIQKRELERLVIELSWKSSRIEGNTYTLLDTEKLILENKEAAGHSHDEAQMILNHKDAFYFIREHAKSFAVVTRAYIEQLHAIIVKDLGVNTGLRKHVVGIIGSTYLPLDNQHQITEGLDALIAAIHRADSPYEKAMLALLGISYLQPFEDGNKRTARLLGNAILFAHGLAPLSYRSVDEGEYRDATLVFYEINSVIPFKKIFVNQYDFAAKNYAVT